MLINGYKVCVIYPFDPSTVDYIKFLGATFQNQNNKTNGSEDKNYLHSNELLHIFNDWWWK